MAFGQLLRRYLTPSKAISRRESRLPDTSRRGEGPPSTGVRNGNGNGGRSLPSPRNGNGNGKDYVEGEFREIPPEDEEDMAKGKSAGPSGKKKRNGRKAARAVGEVFTRGAEAGARAAGKAYRGAKGKYEGYQRERAQTKAEEEAFWEAQEQAAGVEKLPPSWRKAARGTVREKAEHEFEVRSRAAELGIPEYGQHMRYDRSGKRWVPDTSKPSFQKSVSQLEREIQQHETAIRAGTLQEKALERLEKEEFPSFGRKAGRIAAKGAGKAAVGAYKKLRQEQSPIGQALRRSRTRTPLQDIGPPQSRRPGAGFPRISETLRPGGGTGRPRGFGIPRISDTLRPKKRPPLF